jgi:hypothetical protein
VLPDQRLEATILSEEHGLGALRLLRPYRAFSVGGRPLRLVFRRHERA